MRWTLVATVALVGCNGGLFGGGGGLAGDNDDGFPAPSREADQTFSGDLTEGAVIDDLEWANSSPLFCWPATENENFDGAHVFFPVDLPSGREVAMRVEPASGVDVSVYVLIGSSSEPPSTVASRCEEQSDATNDRNPGQAEVVWAIGGNSDQPGLLGVAGAHGATSGAFDVEIWVE
jgi:hypothetical protein